ncbi:epoxide hydrolase [Mangrovimicrobium sediminis]|uniref:Epoxide hydrolase n=1 Tax=Mangrovimicrobium sediminis TaxID=2562682 RepID=A0A4Z0LZB1_9GAMM|nr:epoxide hydrolase family protein [Haliea sp. SAOS-164]TGD72564.1 epoxide hydrolase [Haliea sp. SAOS-164]
MQPTPFTLDVPQAQLDDLHARLDATRWPDDLDNADWRYGVEAGWLREMVQYWRAEYDWRATERRINALPNYRVEIDGNPLHFVHLRGKGPAPTPLLLIHGWPWTFMDFEAVIGPLTDPASHGGDPVDAFDLVIPSLPGHGLSMPLAHSGLDVPAHAALFSKLMTKVLGYTGFGVAGGDWGAAISHLIAHHFPQQVTGLLASIPYYPGLDLNTLAAQDYAADEQWMLERSSTITPQVISHFVVQSNEPQTLAYALADSPVGTAAWLWARRRAWSDCDGDVLAAFDRDFLCTQASLYWLNGSIATSLRTYCEHARAGGLPFRPLHQRTPVIDTPCGYLVAPREVMLIPRAPVARNTNLQRWTCLPRGGHFSFAEAPELWTQELRDFFRPLRSAS